MFDRVHEAEQVLKGLFPDSLITMDTCMLNGEATYWIIAVIAEEKGLRPEIDLMDLNWIHSELKLDDMFVSSAAVSLKPVLLLRMR